MDIQVHTPKITTSFIVSELDFYFTHYDSHRAEKRNVYADLKQQFGEEIRYIDAVAIMTDTDNAHGIVTAYYGDIYFSKN